MGEFFVGELSTFKRKRFLALKLLGNAANSRLLRIRAGAIARIRTVCALCNISAATFLKAVPKCMYRRQVRGLHDFALKTSRSVADLAIISRTAERAC